MLNQHGSSSFYLYTYFDHVFLNLNDFPTYQREYRLFCLNKQVKIFILCSSYTSF